MCCVGSAAKSGGASGSGVEERQVEGERMLSANEQRDIQRISTIQISKESLREDRPTGPSTSYLNSNFPF